MNRYDDEDEGAKPKAPRFKLMNFTMLMLALLFISKISAVAGAAHELISVREAQAEDKAEEKDTKHADEAKAADKPAAEAGKDTAAAPDEKKTEEANADAKTDDAAGDEKKDDKDAPKDKDGKPIEEKTLGAGKLTIKEVEALKAKDAGSAYTPSEIDLLQSLTKRREQLDEREKELDLKAKVLDATELRITTKVNDMKMLQDQLSKVVAQYNQQQDSEIKGLVKIYENMKPGDAANIFNGLDMPILLEVIDKMSERKVAPVLAQMDPKRAATVTQELAEMRRGRASLNAAASDAAKPTN